MAKRDRNTATLDAKGNEQPSELLRELVAHLRQNRTQLREEWVARISETRLLTAMTKEEIFAEATSVYDSYVEALETETFEALQTYARNLSERIIPRGVETHEVVGIVLLLRDVLARSLFAKYQNDFRKLNRILDAYEPAANRIANTVAVGFVQERERVIRQQQEAIRELSTEARAAADRAVHLARQGPDHIIRLNAGFVDAQVDIQTGKTQDAERHLYALRQQAYREGYTALELEARLLSGMAELQSRNAAEAHARLTKLSSDARSKGFLLIARKADAALHR